MAERSMEATENGLRSQQRKGGYRAAMFILLMSGLESIGFIANTVSLVLYFTRVMHFDLADASTTLTNFMGAALLITILGGFISDTYMTRFNTVVMFGLVELVGYVLITIQAQYKNLRPDPNCLTCKPEGSNKALFYLTLCLLALGYGGVRGALPALGADQFDKNDPKEKKQLGSFFNWLLMSVNVGATFSVTVMVWVSSEKSTWAVGFLTQMLIAIVGFGLLTVGKPFYRNRAAGDSPLIRILQVIVVSIRNRKLSLPDSPEHLYENNDKEFEEKIPHTNQCRSLDKAAILPPNTTPAPWKVCTVTQVEELKILTRMLPILASTILMNTCLAQLQTFYVEQGSIMDLSLGHFSVPPSSIPVIPLLFMHMLVPLYEFIVVPFARRITGNPTGITHFQRVAVGLVLSAISMAVAAAIEVKRRNAFNLHQEKISVFWLALQYGIFGIADMFTLVGLMEFFYSEAPAGMRSLATSFSYLSVSIGYFLSSVFVQAVEGITGRISGNGKGWLHGSDFNKNHLDRFYWFLVVLSCVNFGVYVLCAKWYKYRINVHDDGRVVDVGNEEGEKSEGREERERE